MAEVMVGGTRLHVQRLGSGPASVVFLHGLVMDNLSSYYYTLAPAVAAFADVLLYDLRGHGLSQRTPSGYTVPGLLEDLTGLLAELKIQRPVWLVGHSFGGLLALAHAAASHPRVAGMALLDPLVPLGPWQARMTATLELEGEQRDRRIAQSFASWLGRHSQRKTTRLARKAEKLVHETTLVQDLRTSPSLTEEELSAVTCPALVLVGEDSDVRGEAQHVATVMPRCSLHVVPGCTHSVLWEQTAEVREVTARWLKDRIAGG